MSLYDQIQKIRGGFAPTTPKGNFARARWWKPAKAGRDAFRFYRFMEGGVKTLFWTRDIHWPQGDNSFDCKGDGCEACQTATQLMGDPLTREQGWQIRKQTRYHFVMVSPTEPGEFSIWECSEAPFRQVIAAFARDGGWTGGWPTRPEDGKWDQYNAEVMDLCQKAEKAADEICGPHGRDVMLTSEPKGRGFAVVGADVFRSPGKVLPKQENDEVPNPREKREAMEQAKARKAERGE